MELGRLGELLRIALALSGLVVALLVLLPDRATLAVVGGAGLPSSVLFSGRGGASPGPDPRPAAKEPTGQMPERPRPTPIAVEPRNKPAASVNAERSSDTPPVADTATPSDLDLKLFRQVVANDAGTLAVGKQIIQIAGITPLPADAQCERPGGFWPCGARARTAFRGWLRSRSVLCSLPTASRDAPKIVAPCLLGEADVGEWLVVNGWALAMDGSRYAGVQAKAQKKQLGIWEFGVDLKRRDAPPKPRR